MGELIVSMVENDCIVTGMCVCIDAQVWYGYTFKNPLSRSLHPKLCWMDLASLDFTGGFISAPPNFECVIPFGYLSRCTML